MATPETATAASASDANYVISVSARTPSWYAIAARDTEAEVRIYDEIGAFGITAAAFVQDLQKIKAKVINLRLNTPGGEVFAATAIYNALAEHPARIIVHVDGVAASSGSFIAMSGDEVRMADNAYLMIHNPTGGVMGEAKDMLAYASSLEKVTGNLAATYAKKTGKPESHWRELMAAETWFTAAEAKEAGLADEVFAAEKKSAAAIRSGFDARIYNKIPDPVRRMWGLIPPANSQPETQAPDDSARAEPSPAVQQEQSAMADESTTQAAPAQTPAPANNGNPQGEPPVAVAEARREELIRLNQTTIDNARKAARNDGLSEGVKLAHERALAISAACPGKPDMALAAILAGQTPEATKLAYDATVQAEARAKEAADAKDLEIARWRSLAENGGFPNGVNLSMIEDASADSDRPLTKPEAEAKAKNEWDTKPGVRKGFTSKDRYVAWRADELRGLAARQTSTVSA